MATLDEVIELTVVPSDEPEAQELAQDWETRFSGRMRHERSSDKVIADSKDGILAEREFFTEGTKRTGHDMIGDCIRRQKSKKKVSGPDGANTDVKSTNLARQKQPTDLAGAFARDYKLRVKFYPELGLRSPAYALVLRCGGRSWFVGWATREEVLNGYYNRAFESFEIPISRLRSPATWYAQFPKQ